MSTSTKEEQVASAWIARRDRGDWTAEDDAALRQWLDAAMAHRVAYLRLNAAWEHSRRLKALGAGIPGNRVPARGQLRRSSLFEAAGESTPEGAIGTLEHPIHGRRDETEPAPSARAAAARGFGNRVLTGILGATKVSPGLAATVVLTAILVAGWVAWTRGPVYRTDVGGLASIPLPDGSKVTLNTDSEIRVAVTPSERHVTLDQGEAFFEVAKDPSRPFVVSAGGSRVTAVGTKFSVRRDGDELTVVVTEGHVRVERIGAGSAVPPAQLSAGTVARAVRSDTLIRHESIETAEEYLSWRQGFLVFRDASLGEAVAEFNRYNTRKLVIEDPSIAAIHVGGNFRSTNLDAFVRLLEQGFSLQAVQYGDRIVLKPT